MTCKDVVTLLDRLPLAEWPSRQLAQARRHARECTECQLALAAAETLEIELRQLPEPAPQEGSAAAVLLRIERLDEDRDPAGSDAEQVAPSGSGRDWPAWATAAAGAGIGLGALAYGWIAGAATFDPAPPLVRFESRALLELPPSEPAVVALAAGVLLCIAGLFNSVRSARLGGAARDRT